MDFVDAVAVLAKFLFIMTVLYTVYTMVRESQTVVSWRMCGDCTNADLVFAIAGKSAQTLALVAKHCADVFLGWYKDPAWIIDDSLYEALKQH